MMLREAGRRIIAVGGAYLLSLSERAQRPVDYSLPCPQSRLLTINERLFYTRRTPSGIAGDLAASVEPALGILQRAGKTLEDQADLGFA